MGTVLSHPTFIFYTRVRVTTEDQWAGLRYKTCQNQI